MVVVGGVETGVIVAGDSGVEIGVTKGVVEVGVIGLVGVIIGVVMSFWVVEIEEENTCLLAGSSSLLYPIASFSKTVEPELAFKN